MPLGRPEVREAIRERYTGLLSKLEEVLYSEGQRGFKSGYDVLAEVKTALVGGWAVELEYFTVPSLVQRKE